MHPRRLAIADFTYDLPPERIAQHPLADRDAARLLLWRDQRIEDHTFRDLPGLLPPNALLVMNDTRVVHARVAFRRHTGALIECMVLNPADGGPIGTALLEKGSSRWWCMVGNAKRWKGEELSAVTAIAGLRAHRLEQREGEHLVEFRWDDDRPFMDILEAAGQVPLPPYMRREAGPDDRSRYNTVFAEHPGSVAAPTASLHFTPDLMKAVRQQGIPDVRVTLHVGAGTFLPVKSAEMADHAMHAEQVRIPATAVKALLDQLEQGPVVPVGTTALRSIESLYWTGADLLTLGDADFQGMDVDQWRPYAGTDAVPVKEALAAVLDHLERQGADALTGRTRLLIAPGYRFRIASGLITNFHQPNSTLLLLVAALIGPDWERLYAHALASGYRFLSYGDGSLLLPRPSMDNRAV